jgi:hypothetical protein
VGNTAAAIAAEAMDNSFVMTIPVVVVVVVVDVVVVVVVVVML